MKHIVIFVYMFKNICDMMFLLTRNSSYKVKLQQQIDTKLKLLWFEFYYI